MLKNLCKRKKDNKGFSLIELILAIAILAILVGLVAPRYIKYVEQSRKVSDANNIDEMVKAIQISMSNENSSLLEGIYTIQVDEKKSCILNATSLSSKARDSARMYKASVAMKEAISEFPTIRLKSTKWDSGCLRAVIKIDANGGTSVSYSPKELSDMMKNGLKNDPDQSTKKKPKTTLKHFLITVLIFVVHLFVFAALLIYLYRSQQDDTRDYGRAEEEGKNAMRKQKSKKKKGRK